MRGNMGELTLEEARLIAEYVKSGKVKKVAPGESSNWDEKTLMQKRKELFRIAFENRHLKGVHK